jgi:hypothetical protein
LHELSEQTGVCIVLDPRATRANPAVTAKFQVGITLETAMGLLTDMTELACVAMGNALSVTTPANARRLDKEQAKRKQVLQRLTNANNACDLLDQPVHGTFRERSLIQILDKLDFVTIIVDPRVHSQARQPLTLRFLNGVTLEAALVMLTDMAGLKFVTMGNAFYVTSPARVKMLESKERKRAAARDRRKFEKK